MLPLSQGLVACNVYVSAGGKHHHRELLLQLLQVAQHRCSNVTLEDGAVVHAFADSTYNRSSFHLAGKALYIADIVSDLAVRAIQGLRAQQKADNDHQHPHVSASSSQHPNIGLVDHVAVMPLQGQDVALNVPSQDTNPSLKRFAPYTSSGWAALQIGQALTDHQTQVYYYGSAHEQGTSLANVRRKQTPFFKSGGLALGDATDTSHSSIPETAITSDVAIVGAPWGFVENYNIRLRNTCSKQTAQSLTRFLRERDGGLVGVEALTLPYSHGRYEVACNLLRPDLASATTILARMKEWESHQKGASYVETHYRVGTTAQQCLQVLAHNTKEERHQHNIETYERFKANLEEESL